MTPTSRSTLAASLGFFGALALSACGGNEPDIDQIKEDFANPTGDTQDKDSVIALHSKQDAAGGSLGLAAGPAQGFGLTAEGHGVFRRIAPRVLFDGQIRRLETTLRTPEARKLQPLTSAEACVDQAELER